MTRDKEVILGADKVILPGVGAFGDAMEKIRGYGLEEVIKEVIYVLYITPFYCFDYIRKIMFFVT